MDLTTAELYDLVDAFDSDKDGRIDYREFIEMAGTSIDHGRRRSSEHSPSRRNSDGRDRSKSRGDDRRRSAEELRDRIKRALRRLSREKRGGLLQAFEEFDQDGSGLVTRSEFRRGLRDLGLKLDDADVFDLVERLDRDGDGRVSYREFRQFVDDFRRDWLEEQRVAACVACPCSFLLLDLANDVLKVFYEPVCPRLYLLPYSDAAVT
eukprot:scaffold7341_cov229-Pinguiococcus_pyrenoidosus.AAC.13